MKIPSAPNNICLIKSYLDGIFQQYHLNPSYYGDVFTSITEAVNNAMIHGNRLDESKFVHLQLQRKKDCLVFRISDEGHGFDPKAIPDPTKRENLECCGGRGVFIINKLSHGVNYLNNGSTVEIVFNF
ncbi:MAG: ATP-binding protein [Saprospiraceae bacterium]